MQLLNPFLHRVSPVVRGIARQLIADMRQHLPSENYKTWLNVPTEMTRGQKKELGMAVRHGWDGEYYVTCCFHNSTEYFGGSNVIKRGTIDDIMTWIADDSIIDDVALMLQDLYENTHTWD